jgi:hypothetical protein
MRRGADPDRGIIELARLLPRERDEFLQIARRSDARTIST